MTDYIKREDAIKELLGCVPTDVHEIKDLDVIRLMLALPAADVAPVRHGHWIIQCVRKYELSDGGTAYVPEYECSWCGFTTESYVRLDEPIMPEDADFPKYCEYCGAKMDGGDTDA